MKAYHRIIAGLILVLGSWTASAQVTLGTGGSGGTYYKMATDVQKLLPVRR